MQDDQRRAPAAGHGQFRQLALGQAHIPHLHRRERAGRAMLASEIAGDHAHGTGIVGQRQRGYRVAGDGLVAGRRHLVLRRQVHPQLHHFQGAARLREGRRVKLFMQDAGAGRHPLHVTGADHAALARGIAVRHFALVDDGHRFKAAVRVRADAGRTGAGCKFGGAGIVEQQEWAQLLAMAVIRKHRAHGETIAYPVLARCAVDTCDFVHLDLLLRFALRWRQNRPATMKRVDSKIGHQRSKNGTIKEAACRI
ncbi:hypothetical protein D3C72_1586270 [compost metagenome]